MTVLDWIIFAVSGIVTCFLLGVLIGYTFADVFIYFYEKFRKK